MAKTIYINIISFNVFIKYFLIVLFSFSIINCSECQTTQPGNDLNLTSSDRQIENTISIYTSRSDYENFKITPGKKINMKVTILVVNGDTIVPERVNTRGNTTLAYRRKSLSFGLKSKAIFHHGCETESFKKFFALSLSMDRNYINNRIAFEMMENVNLFGLFYTFCELRINDTSEGIYLITERPEDWALKKNNSPMILRRGYNNEITKIEINKNAERNEIKTYRRNYRRIYSIINRYEGETLYKELSGLIDIDNYMKWLAFNYFMHNGDYTDEIYLYIDHQSNKFNIIPWDYDDLFSRAPHEGYSENRNIPGEKLIFSTEDLLDQKIANDRFLYKIYLIRFGELLKQLSPAIIKKIISSTFEEIYPYYMKEEIISMSKYDRYPNANLENLKNFMITVYHQLILSRDFYLRYIEERIL